MEWLVAGSILGVLLGAAIGALWARRRGLEEIARLRERHASLVTSKEMLERELAEKRESEQALNRIIEQKHQEISRLEQEVSRLSERLAQEQKQAADKLALLEDAQKRLNDTFKALSAEALRSNNQTFLDIAQETLAKFQQGARADLDKRAREIEQLAKPVHQSLEKMESRLGELERARESAYATIKQQIEHMAQDQEKLRKETLNLVRALRQPQARGRWGELQLKRVVEMAGMLDHCDFTEQQHVEGRDGERAIRPDMIVNLPQGRHIVVDSKVSLAAYMDAMEAEGDRAEALLQQHAAQIREHIKALGTKAYWDRVRREIGSTPEFVVMFVPGEDFFSAALKVDAGLIEFGVEHKVIVATPTTLIALLKAVAYGWQQEALAKNAEQVAALGRELYERIRTLGKHWADVGRHLGRTVNAYNKATGSLESRVLSGARKFEALKAAPDQASLTSPEQVEAQPRTLTASEFQKREDTASKE